MIETPFITALSPLILFLLFRLWHRQLVTGGSDESRHRFPIIYTVDDEMWLSTRIGRGLLAVRIEDRTRPGLFHEKLVVANHADHFAVTINTVLSEHFLIGDAPGAANLITDIFHKVQI